MQQLLAHAPPMPFCVIRTHTFWYSKADKKRVKSAEI